MLPLINTVFLRPLYLPAPLCAALHPPLRPLPPQCSFATLVSNHILVAFYHCRAAAAVRTGHIGAHHFAYHHPLTKGPASLQTDQFSRQARIYQ